MQIPVRLARVAGYLLLSIVLTASFLANPNIGWQRYLYILLAPVASIWGGSAALLQRRCLSTFSRRKHFCQNICGCFSFCACVAYHLSHPAVPVGTSLCSYELKAQKSRLQYNIFLLRFKNLCQPQSETVCSKSQLSGSPKKLICCRKGGNYGHCSFCFYLKYVFGCFCGAFSPGAWCCHIHLNYRSIFDLSKIQAVKRAYATKHLLQRGTR